MGTFADQYGPWAVVTGAASGVGLAFAHELNERDVSVVLVDISPTVDQVAADLPGENRAVCVDLRDGDWITRLAEAAADLDVGLAVANAATFYIGPYLDMGADERAHMLAVNCASLADLASWALPSMAERGRGGFVATSSGSALAGTAGVGFYSATKAFAVNLVEAIGWELAGRGVDSLAVVAPTMDTPGFRAGGHDVDQLPAPPTDPRDVVIGALDALGEGGRWLADDSLAFVAGVDRDARVDLMSQATTGMYPDRFGS